MPFFQCSFVRHILLTNNDPCMNNADNVFQWRIERLCSNGDLHILLQAPVKSKYSHKSFKTVSKEIHPHALLNMAAAFVDQLPIVPISDLPSEDCECCICMLPYETGSPDSDTFEHAVRLPCKHVIGEYCIADWIARETEDEKNTCPFCRCEFFEFPSYSLEVSVLRLVIRGALLGPNNFSWETGFDEEEVPPDATVVSIYWRKMLSFVLSGVFPFVAELFVNVVAGLVERLVQDLFGSLEEL